MSTTKQEVEDKIKTLELLKSQAATPAVKLLIEGQIKALKGIRDGVC